jgi:hypothetical protein
MHFAFDPNSPSHESKAPGARRTSRHAPPLHTKISSHHYAHSACCGMLLAMATTNLDLFEVEFSADPNFEHSTFWASAGDSSAGEHSRSYDVHTPHSIAYCGSNGSCITRADGLSKAPKGPSAACASRSAERLTRARARVEVRCSRMRMIEQLYASCRLLYGLDSRAVGLATTGCGCLAVRPELCTPTSVANLARMLRLARRHREHVHVLRVDREDDEVVVRFAVPLYLRMCMMGRWS